MSRRRRFRPFLTDAQVAEARQRVLVDGESIAAAAAAMGVRYWQIWRACFGWSWRV